MSNLQDVPLTEPENILPKTETDTTKTDNETSTPRSNSLKRFFKLTKKANPTQNVVEDEPVALEDEANNKDTVKPGTINRLLTRLKSTSKTDPSEASTSITSAVEETSANKPVPNAKPTLKASISTYWKQLFHRQKAANRQTVNDEQQSPGTDMEVEPNQLESQSKQSDQTKIEAALPATPVTSRESLKMPGAEKSLEEEVQMLAISDEIVDKNEA